MGGAKEHITGWEVSIEGQSDVLYLWSESSEPFASLPARMGVPHALTIAQYGLPKDACNKGPDSRHDHRLLRVYRR
jgi:hypothetical protein